MNFDDQSHACSLLGHADIVLPAPIRQVLTLLPEHERPRFDSLFATSVHALQDLSDLDLSSVAQHNTEEKAHEAWELMGPAVDAAFGRVKSLVQLVRTLFPESVDKDEVSAALEALDAANATQGLRNSTGIRRRMDEADESDIQEAVRLLHSMRASIEDELALFEKHRRQTQVGVDRWFLMDHVDHFQARMSGSIGELIFLTARSFADVRKSEVVPFYSDDLEGAIVLRQTISVLRDNVMFIAHALSRADEHPFLLDCARRVLREIEQFRSSPGYAPMRAADKRMVLRIRSELMEYLDSQSHDEGPLRKTMASLVTLLELLRGVNMREVLRVNDEKTVIQVESRLQAADRALAEYRIREARSALSGALRLIARMRGKYEQLDSVANLLQHVDFSACDAYELEAGRQWLFSLLSACQHTTSEKPITRSPLAGR